MKKITYANILKIFASIVIVVIHVVSIKWYTLDPNSTEWEILNIYDSLSRWGVPIFTMVTGMLLLPEEKKILNKTIFTKYIKRILIVFITWTILYAIANKILINPEMSKKDFIFNCINGHYHLWYLQMLIGLYLATPIIKLITKRKNKKVIEYFLIIWFIFECCLNTLIKLPAFENLQFIYNNMHISFFQGYIGYYILGYYLSQYQLNKKTRYVSYILGILAIVVNIFATKYLKVNNFEKTLIFYDDLSMLSCLSAIAVFVGIKQIFENKEMKPYTKEIIDRITKISFGVYLIHPMFIIFINALNIDIFRIPIIISIPLATLIIYIISALCAEIISKIPLIGKKLV